MSDDPTPPPAGRYSQLSLHGSEPPAFDGSFRVPLNPPVSQTPSQETWLEDALTDTYLRPRRLSFLYTPASATAVEVHDLTLDSHSPKRARRSSPNSDIETLSLPKESPAAREPTPPAIPSIAEPLGAYACPVCFTPPLRATLLPCGHVLCGACVFVAVKTMQRRNDSVPGPRAANAARCPVCRAEIAGWDGKGGGVIGLQPQVVSSV